MLLQKIINSLNLIRETGISFDHDIKIMIKNKLYDLKDEVSFKVVNGVEYFLLKIEDKRNENFIDTEIWHDTTKELPQVEENKLYSKEVLIYLKSGIYISAYYAPKRNIWQASTSDEIQLSDVTHWMEIPIIGDFERGY